MGYMADSLVGRSRRGTSSSLSPARVTQYTSDSNPLMCSDSFLNSVAGTRRGKLTSPWPVRAISSRIRWSMRVMALHP